MGCGLYYKSFTIVNNDSKLRFSLEHNRIMTLMLQSQFKLLSSYDHIFIIHATVITIVNYNRSVIMIVNYDCKTIILQATGR